MITFQRMSLSLVIVHERTPSIPTITFVDLWVYVLHMPPILLIAPHQSDYKLILFG